MCKQILKRVEKQIVFTPINLSPFSKALIDQTLTGRQIRKWRNHYLIRRSSIAFKRTRYFITS